MDRKMKTNPTNKSFHTFNHRLKKSGLKIKNCSKYKSNSVDINLGIEFLSC